MIWCKQITQEHFVPSLSALPGLSHALTTMRNCIPMCLFFISYTKNYLCASMSLLRKCEFLCQSQAIVERGREG